jgi:hypothetical protein
MHGWVGVCLCLLAFAPPAAGENADVVGRWDVLVSMNQGAPTPAPLVLQKEGGKITGVLTTPQGDRPVEASVKEKDITIWFTIPSRNGPVNVTMNGTVERDGMNGSVDITGRPRGKWSAKRATAEPSSAATPPAATPRTTTPRATTPPRATAPPAAAPPSAAPPSAAPAPSRVNVSGTWTMNVETSAGSGTPAITLKQNGGELTGRYRGQLGEALVAGTVRGNTIEFAFDVSLEGAPLHVVYTGTAVDSTSMKGTVKLGALADGTFTGKKQP